MCDSFTHAAVPWRPWHNIKAQTFHYFSSFSQLTWIRMRAFYVSVCVCEYGRDVYVIYLIYCNLSKCTRKRGKECARHPFPCARARLQKNVNVHLITYSNHLACNGIYQRHLAPKASSYFAQHLTSPHQTHTHFFSVNGKRREMKIRSREYFYKIKRKLSRRPKNLALDATVYVGCMASRMAQTANIGRVKLIFKGIETECCILFRNSSSQNPVEKSMRFIGIECSGTCGNA